MLTNTKIEIELNTSMCYCLTLIGSMRSVTAFTHWTNETELQRQRINNLDKEHGDTLDALVSMGLIVFNDGSSVVFDRPYVAWRLTYAGQWIYKNWLLTQV